MLGIERDEEEELAVVAEPLDRVVGERVDRCALPGCRTLEFAADPRQVDERVMSGKPQCPDDVAARTAAATPVGLRSRRTGARSMPLQRTEEATTACSAPSSSDP